LQLNMIQICDLQKIVDGKTIVDIPALEVQAGEIVALTGSVDNGKETLFALLTGRMQASGGTVHLDGIDPYSEKSLFSQKAGVMFADDNLYKRQSALGNLAFYCHLHHLPRQRAVEVLAWVGLTDHAKVPLERLAPSLLRRVSFGRAVVHNPLVLLLEEPFARCDDASIELFSKILRQVSSSGGTTLLFAEESPHLSALCSKIYRLEHGKIADAYRPGEVQRSEIPFMIPAKPEGKVVLVDPADIFFVVAQDDRTFLQTAEGLLPTQFTLAELEKRLSRSGFFRAHRGYLVNLQHVKEIIPYTRDSYSLRLKDAKKTEIPLSKAAAQDLRELLGY
jgi:ABC-2 type transport system ATP-binding protein